MLYSNRVQLLSNHDGSKLPHVARAPSLRMTFLPPPNFLSSAYTTTMSALKVFLTTWNTGLQGSKAQSQDLTSWLLPVLQSSSNEPEMPKGEIPDIYAIGIQELLPLHLARQLPSHVYCIKLTG